MDTTTLSPTLKPLLRWAGGKYNQRQVCDRVRELYAAYRNTHLWVEPFCGGMGITHQIAPDRALLNDVNSVLIAFYQHLKNGGSISPDICDRDYEEVRAEFNHYLEIGEDSLVDNFYYLNRAGFNGLWRVNRLGRYNVPQGRNSKGEPLKVELPSTKYIRDWQSFTQNHKFICGDWQGVSTFVDLRLPSFVYCDPPYDSTFAGYASSGFNWDEQKHLAQWLAMQPHPTVASNAATDRIVELYSNLGFEIELIDCRRSISCNGDRAKATEILAYKGCEEAIA